MIFSDPTPQAGREGVTWWCKDYSVKLAIRLGVGGFHVEVNFGGDPCVDLLAGGLEARRRRAVSVGAMAARGFI